MVPAGSDLGGDQPDVLLASHKCASSPFVSSFQHAAVCANGADTLLREHGRTSVHLTLILFQLSSSTLPPILLHPSDLRRALPQRVASSGCQARCPSQSPAPRQWTTDQTPPSRLFLPFPHLVLPLSLPSSLCFLSPSPLFSLSPACIHLASSHSPHLLLPYFSPPPPITSQVIPRQPPVCSAPPPMRFCKSVVYPVYRPSAEQTFAQVMPDLSNHFTARVKSD
eukprot:1737622-Rhodomonas_salina.2